MTSVIYKQVYRQTLRYLSTVQPSAVSKEPVHNVKPFSKIPSPQGKLPFLGHLLTINKNTKTTSMSEYTMKLFKELGPIFKLQLPGGNTLVLINDPTAIEEVLRNQGNYPSRIVQAEDAFSWVYRKRNEEPMFAFQRGEQWRKNRSKLGKQVLPANVLGYCPGFNRISDRMIRNIQDTQDKDGYVEDMRTLVTYWSLEASAYFVLGADIDSRNDSDTQQHAKQLQDAMSKFLRSIDSFTKSLPYLYKIYPTPALKRLNNALDKILAIGYMYTNRHFERIRESAKKGEKVYGMSLLEQWLIDDNMTEQEAVRNAVDMLGVGLDNTFNTTAFILYELAKCQDIQQKLYDQVTSVLGEIGEADSESLQNMPYLGHVIKETQRLYPVVATVPRTLFTDIELLGYNIPAKTTILFAQFPIGYDPQYFKDPHLYNPDRWSTDKIHPFAQLPFGFGPKGCWGRRFAEVEIKVLLTKICRQYIMSSDDRINTRLPFHEETFIRPDAPVKIKFIPRSK